MLIQSAEVFELMNEYGEQSRPFLFGIDFKMKQGFFTTPDAAADSGIYFNINGIGNELPNTSIPNTVQLIKFPISLTDYKKAFQLVHHNLLEGNSYLTNLTFPTEVELNLTLSEVFTRSRARYRLLYKDQFVVFSPEIFVQIADSKISSFPMKGTIDASLPGAEQTILNDRKESAEHNTIVDLIRNDLSMIASDVKVERFRYIEKITTSEKSLFQVSSEISGTLPAGYQAHLGTMLSKLLPAGSVTGAPKKRTLEIIQEAEIYSRGFYTGVFGYFDGTRLDSGVMIRFIRNENGKLVYCSGGGITVNSNPATEYNELMDKVYVPIV